MLIHNKQTLEETMAVSRHQYTAAKLHNAAEFGLVLYLSQRLAPRRCTTKKKKIGVCVYCVYVCVEKSHSVNLCVMRL